RDWSSDVCSSDLGAAGHHSGQSPRPHVRHRSAFHQGPASLRRYGSGPPGRRLGGCRPAGRRPLRQRLGLVQTPGERWEGTFVNLSVVARLRADAGLSAVAGLITLGGPKTQRRPAPQPPKPPQSQPPLALQLLGKLPPELGHLGRDDYLAVGLVWIPPEIIPMVVLSGVKSFVGGDFRYDGVGPDARLVQLGDVLAGFRFLLVGMIKNDGAVLGAHIGSLAVQSGGVVDGEED